MPWPVAIRFRRALLLLLAAAALWGCGGGTGASADEGAPVAQRVLVFSRTLGFRHDSIPAGIAAVQALGQANGFAVDATEDATRFSAQGLRAYQAVIFLSTTGDVLDSAQRAALQGFIQGGGGFVGVHAAADTEYDWPWYGELVGARLLDHPAIQNATIRVVDGRHPSTQGLTDPWPRRDEWYDFQRDPSAFVQVLLRLDETTYQGGRMGASHPIAWARSFDGGRSWYTGLGHTEETFGEPDFRRHLLGGIRWAAGWAP